MHAWERRAEPVQDVGPPVTARRADPQHRAVVERPTTQSLPVLLPAIPAATRAAPATRIRRASIRPDPPAVSTAPTRRIIRRLIAADTVVTMWDDREGLDTQPPTPSVAALNAQINQRRGPSANSAWGANHEFNNGGADEPGQRIQFDQAATIPHDITTANGEVFNLSAHVVANLMNPRDDAHRVPLGQIKSALDARTSQNADGFDPRWNAAKTKYQDNSLFIVVGATTVVTAYMQGWNAVQKHAFDDWKAEGKTNRAAEALARRSAKTKRADAAAAAELRVNAAAKELSGTLAQDLKTMVITSVAKGELATDGDIRKALIAKGMTEGKVKGTKASLTAAAPPAATAKGRKKK